MSFFQYCAENDPLVVNESSIDEIDTIFFPGMPLGLLENNDMDEVSGLAGSRLNEAFIWSHNDSGGKSRLFLTKENGEDYGIVNLPSIENRDWEDLAIAPFPGTGISTLYIADIGDNLNQYETKFIYRINEPNIENIQDKLSLNVTDISVIEFSYPDGNHNAETLLTDPKTGDLFIVTKSINSTGLYQLTFPYSFDEVNVLTKVGTLDISNAVGGEISPDGREILIKNYNSIFHWTLDAEENTSSVIDKTPIRLPYFREPQGEAIGWKADKSGYYTISEEPQGIEASVYFYARL